MNLQISCSSNSSSSSRNSKIRVTCFNIFFSFSSFKTGFLDTITSTAESKDCPGVCVHAIATLICYEVLENVQCPESKKCCLEPPPINTTDIRQPNNTLLTTTQLTTYKPTTTPFLQESTTTKPMATTTFKVNKFIISMDLEIKHLFTVNGTIRI